MVAVAVFVFTGCATTIIPPEKPGHPVMVCIVDYGRHASLVLPAGDGSVEYEYGEWKWFALGRKSLRIIPTLFWPTQGTLGRRTFPHPPDPHVLAADWKEPQSVLSFHVSLEKADKLREQLARRYETNFSTGIFNAEYEMNFVKDPADYTAFHNCNHELAQWLRQLDCEIKGAVMFARFKLKESHPRSRIPATRRKPRRN